MGKSNEALVAQEVDNVAEDSIMPQREQRQQMSRRREIRMTPEEQTAFLQQARKAALATLDQQGFPHIVAMGFVVLDGVMYMTSYAKAQKVLNARRNPKVSVMIETGTDYAEFRGVMIRGQCEVIEDPTFVRHILQANRTPQTDTGNPAGQEALARATKRVVLKILPEKVVSWDHTKLGGRY